MVLSDSVDDHPERTTHGTAPPPIAGCAGEVLNFTRAAERVHVTQSTLSHQIRKLEGEIGYALFDRATDHVALTDAGERFLAYARQRAAGT